jgi:hypothetical protein
MENLVRVRENHMMWTVSLFLLMFAGFLYIKPALSFTQDGKIKPFGVKKRGSTIFHVGVFTVVFAAIARLAVSLASRYTV